jgi:hypothetical protein
MVDEAARGIARRARHGRQLTGTTATCQDNELRPLLFSSLYSFLKPFADGSVLRPYLTVHPVGAWHSFPAQNLRCPLFRPPVPLEHGTLFFPVHRGFSNSL